MPYMRVPIIIVKGMKVAPANPFAARSLNKSAAGRHCHRSRVVGSGMRFCSAAIEPDGAVVLSNVSDAPRGLQASGVALRNVTAHQPIDFVFGSCCHD